MDDPLVSDPDARELALDQIIDDETLSPRLGLSKTEIQRLAQIARESGAAAFPPVALAGPREDGRYAILDGRYRIAAARLAGWSTIAAIIRPWTSRRELFAEAVRLAAHQGKPMTRKEKRRAVYQLLRDFPESELSTRQLAEIAGVRHNLVAECRRELREGGEPGEQPRRAKPPEVYARRALRDLCRLAEALDGPDRTERLGTTLAEAALLVYADADPAAALALIAAAAHGASELALGEAIPAAVTAEFLVSTDDAPALTPVGGIGAQA
jgi:ParB-like nuclease family protein